MEESSERSASRSGISRRAFFTGVAAADSIAAVAATGCAPKSRGTGPSATAGGEAQGSERQYLTPGEYTVGETKDYDVVMDGDRADMTQMEATKDWVRNPHSWKHGEVACSECHKSHRASVMYCTQCHSDATVPDGWVTYDEGQAIEDQAMNPPSAA